jgi:hypothetical protein
MINESKTLLPGNDYQSYLLRIFIQINDIIVIVSLVSGYSWFRVWIIRFQSWLLRTKLHFCETYHEPYHFKNLFMSQKFNCVKFMTLNTLIASHYPCIIICDVTNLEILSSTSHSFTPRSPVKISKALLITV